MDEITAVMRARKFISEVKPKNIPVPIESYVSAVNGVIMPDDDLKQDQSGYTIPKDGKHYIFVNENHNEERQRFTVCHEIAHILLELPSDHEALPSWSYSKRSPNEIICDVFAAD